MTKMKLIDRRDELIQRLGTVPDNVLAKEFHLTRERVRQLRREKEIPVFGPQRLRHPSGNVRGSRRKKTQEIESYKNELSALKKFELPGKE